MGWPADVLRVNGVTRRSVVAIGEPVRLSLDAAPGGPSPASYFIWLWNDPAPSPVAMIVRGSRIGCTVDPTPLVRRLAPQPFACIAGPDVPPAICASIEHLESPTSAPWATVRSQSFRRPGLVFTLRGAIEDRHAATPLGWSVTNAVTVETH